AALNAWELIHGRLPRRKVTAIVANQAMQAWRDEGLAPQTLFYRRLALEKVWRILDGPKAPTPVDDIQISRPKGGRPVWVPDDTRAAWTVFIAARAWGRFDKRNFARTLRRCGWPQDVRPYNLRHATGLTLSESGVDLRDISSHLGHRSMSTTAGFYVPQLHSRLKSLGKSLEGRFGWGKKKR